MDLFKIDGDFNILVLLFLTCRTFLFECPTGKDNTLLIISYSKASLFAKNILSIELILLALSLP